MKIISALFILLSLLNITACVSGSQSDEKENTEEYSNGEIPSGDKINNSWDNIETPEDFFGDEND